jgi:hypothetical protein
MAQDKIDRLMDRAKKARQDSEQWRSTLDEAAEFAMPHRNLRTSASAGQQRTGKSFDGTAAAALQRGAARLVADFTPPHQKFVDLEAGPFTPQSEQDKLNRELGPLNEVSSTQYLDGQYHNAAQEMAQDLLMGTGAMLIQPAHARSNRFVTFTAVPEATLDFESGVDGGLQAWFRDVPVKPGLIAAQWDDAKIPPEAARLAKDAPDTPIVFKEATYFDHDERIYRYEVIFLGGDAGPSRIVERQSLTSPWVTPRWAVLPGETRGRGPGVNALPDMRVLSKVVEMTLQNAAMAIAGMYTVIHDGVVNPDTVRIAAGAMIPVARNAGSLGPSIQPLTPDRNFDVSQLLTNDLRMQIKKAFLDNQLPTDNGRDPTAFELLQRMKELMQDAAVAYGRLVSEWLIPMHSRVIEILVRRGALKQFVAIDQLFVKVKVNSPLARVQLLEEVENAIRWLGILRQLGGEQGMMYVAKVEEILAWIGAKLGVKADFIVSTAEREQMKKAMQQLAAAAQGMQAQAPADAGSGGAGPRPPLRVVG